MLFAGAFTLVCAVLFILTFRSFDGSTPLEAQGYRFSIVVPDTNNMVAGSDVQQSGVKIGRVVDVKRSGNRARGTIELQARYAPIRSRASVLVRTKSLLGEAYVEVAPGPRGAPLLGDGAQLSSSQVKAHVSFNDFLETFDPTSRANMRELFTGLARAFNGRGRAINDSLGHAQPVAAGLQTVLARLGEQTVDIERLFGDSATVLDALGRRKQALRGAVAAGDRVFAATASRDRSLSATVRELPAFLTQLRHTSDEITDTSGPLNRASGTLITVAPQLNQALEAAERDVPKFDALFRALPRTAATAEKYLPALNRIVKTVPTGFDELYPTLRQLIPVVQLFADYKQSALIGPFVNAGSAFAGTFVGPAGKIGHRANGVVYASNETVVGWTKRLPTNRANPYPTPNGFDKLGTQGFLNSYDCSNTKNPPRLPALGTGVPPCVEQGPWEYRGKTAYYPRLRPAAP